MEEISTSPNRSQTTSPAPRRTSDEPTDGPGEDGKIFISYIVLGVVVTSFVLVTVALGLMAALINLPNCDDSPARDTHARFRREVLENNNKYGFLKEILDKEKIKNAREVYPFCPELLESPVGQLWESKRLPNNIIPIRYELMLRKPIFEITMYNGEVTIEIRVRQPTQYIMLHSKFLASYLPSVKDAAGNELNIACIGDFLPHDYHIIKMVTPLAVGVYKVDLSFTGSLIAFSNGIFEVQYNSTDNEFEGNMLASHFQPVDARLAFPCFDEPEMKAIFSIRLYHPPETTALSNMPALSEDPVEDNEILTIFKDTPRLPIFMIALMVFRSQDFTSRQITTKQGMPIRVWARKSYVEGGSVDGPVRLMEQIFDNYDFLWNEVPEAVPPKLDVFAIPYYPQDSVGHSGLFIFEESKILFLEGNVQERIKQSIALSMAKHIASLWFGNYVTFNWWNELWLQESISDYVKYRAVSKAFPDWRVGDQFVTEELINVLVDDSYPSSHPVVKDVNSPEDIDQLFDSVETSKGAAILRMMDYEIGPYDVYLGLINYLKKSAETGIGNANSFFDALENIRIWTAREFAERWLLQANYPLIRARIEVRDGLSYFTVSQDRFKSDYSIFSGQEPYPSPFDNVWYIPLTCIFGLTPTDGEGYISEFNIEKKTFESLIGDGTVPYKWVHCDVNFVGYYMFDYSVENWDLLGEVLRVPNDNLLNPADRANIIHNLFINTFNGKTSYVQLAKELSYLKIETDYMPIKTAIKHVNDLADILEHRRSFLQLSSYFLDEFNALEYSTDLWTATGDHIEELKREALLDFVCRMQDQYCLNNATTLWYQTFPTTSVTGANNLAPHVRSVVYNYHLQNTYDTGEWKAIAAQYDLIPDIQDRELLIQAASFSRLPWALYRYLQDITNDKESFSKLNFFYTLELLARNPLGREIAWNYYRANYAQIVSDFGYENPEIGSTLINIVKTFSDEFSYLELVDFIGETAEEANSQARLRAIEIVSTNVIWIEEKEEEIISAFGGIRRTGDKVNLENKVNSMKLKNKLQKLYDEKFTWPLNRKVKSI